MENRNLHHKLTSQVPFSSQEVKDSAENFSDRLAELLVENYKLSIIKVDTVFSTSNSLLASRFRINADEVIILSIGTDKIEIGFQAKVASTLLNLHTSQNLLPLRKRYFLNYEVKTDFNNQTVASFFTMNRKELDTRHFMEYAAFMLHNASKLSQDLVMKNGNIIKEKAA